VIEEVEAKGRRVTMGRSFEEREFEHATRGDDDLDRILTSFD
jgi:hypothetical protein